MVVWLAHPLSGRVAELYVVPVGWRFTGGIVLFRSRRMVGVSPGVEPVTLKVDIEGIPPPNVKVVVTVGGEAVGVEAVGVETVGVEAVGVEATGTAEGGSVDTGMDAIVGRLVGLFVGGLVANVDWCSPIIQVETS
jgi:hypothetical protein